MAITTNILSPNQNQGFNPLIGQAQKTQETFQKILNRLEVNAYSLATLANKYPLLIPLFALAGVVALNTLPSPEEIIKFFSSGPNNLSSIGVAADPTWIPGNNVSSNVGDISHGLGETLQPGTCPVDPTIQIPAGRSITGQLAELARISFNDYTPKEINTILQELRSANPGMDIDVVMPGTQVNIPRSVWKMLCDPSNGSTASTATPSPLLQGLATPTPEGLVSEPITKFDKATEILMYGGVISVAAIGFGSLLYSQFRNRKPKKS